MMASYGMTSAYRVKTSGNSWGDMGWFMLPNPLINMTQAQMEGQPGSRRRRDLSSDSSSNTGNNPLMNDRVISLLDSTSGATLANINTNSMISQVQNNVNIQGISNININDMGNWCGSDTNTINIGTSTKKFFKFSQVSTFSFYVFKNIFFKFVKIHYYF